jgi:arylsulfatase A-like enzyme
MIMQMDMLPTVLDAAGIEGPGREGVSLIPYLLSEKTDAPHTEAYWSNGHINTFAAYKDGYKLRMDQYCPGALYNVIEDPFEKKDLSLEMPGKVEELFRNFKIWMSNNQKSLPEQDENYYRRQSDYLLKIKDDPVWKPKKTSPVFGPEGS